ncbi:PucR family transcriptional regulator [Rathayibacter sp. Leaf296]|uniref:PucR family transcriptional regulator n=1 Tax=Rathayibacter sp. Leaf296 TaxID=1736327 RepID=UPI000703BCA5|nr:helix-turn-helix domain-containing protein [Rathayibacter sp. Leaf296]KQQ08229.1 hypothetical protein ASF46_12925 [Rathayibacter sp. Leaf296]
MDSIQEIVDDLARTISRSVAVDDQDLNLLAASSHYDDADPARIEALIGRVVSPERARWAREQGVFRAIEPMRLLGSPELGIKPRLVVPVRVDRELVALLWIIDDGRITADELAAVTAAAGRIRLVLDRRARAREEEWAEVRALALELLSDRPLEGDEIAAELAAAGYFTGSVHFRVLLVSPTARERLDTGEHAAVERALRSALHFLSRHSWLTTQVDGLVVGIVGSLAPLTADRQTAIAETVARESSATLEVAFGGSVADLGLVHRSYEQSLIVRTVRRRRPDRSPLWDDGSAEDLLVGIAAAPIPRHLFPGALDDVLSKESPKSLDVLRSFLDHGGNVSQVHLELGVHRTTIYYRLDRFRDRTGLDLDDGRTRLLVQLWLLAADLGLIGSAES